MRKTRLLFSENRDIHPIETRRILNWWNLSGVLILLLKGDFREVECLQCFLRAAVKLVDQIRNKNTISDYSDLLFIHREKYKGKHNFSDEIMRFEVYSRNKFRCSTSSRLLPSCSTTASRRFEFEIIEFSKREIRTLKACCAGISYLIFNFLQLIPEAALMNRPTFGTQVNAVRLPCASQ